MPPHHWLSMKLVRIGTQIGQESGSQRRPWSSAAYWLAWPTFLIEPHTTCPGLAPLTMGWALPPSSITV